MKLDRSVTIYRYIEYLLECLEELAVGQSSRLMLQADKKHIKEHSSAEMTKVSCVRFAVSSP